MKTSITLTLTTILLAFNCIAQNVGINTTGAAPDNSAILDLNATDKGFLITRADTANITSPAFGLMTLAPIDSCLYIFSGNAWVGLGGAGSNCSCNASPPNSGGSSFTCGSSFTDTRDNKTYGTVQIGNQCWMSENLNYTPSSGNSWCYQLNPAKCVTYGRLYDWDVAANSTSSNTNPSGVKGICPTGWHLPSDAEWKELEMGLGMSQADADATGYRGTNEGDQLKTSSWGGNNSTGFTALPGGSRFNSGVNFYNDGVGGFWWSSTESSNMAWRRDIALIQGEIRRVTSDKDSGFSVRCIKD